MSSQIVPAPTSRPPAEGRPRQIVSNGPRTLFVHGALGLGAAAAVFLAAGPEQGSLGIFLLCAGLVMMACPPRVRVDWRLWAAAGGIVVGGALALLPAHWFHVPTWRITLEAVPAIPLPGSVSPMPWETGFWLALLAVSALAGLFALAHPLRTAGLVGVAGLAVGGCALYTALAIYARRTGWHYPFEGGATFGFLPNRNHTATFLVVGSILSMGLLRLAWRDGRWVGGLLAGTSLALFVAALGFFSASRAGIVFLLVGTLIWAAGLGRRECSAPLLVSLGTLVLAGGLLLAVSGSEVRDRLLRTETRNAADAVTVAPDFRWNIYQDTARLIQDAPLTGVGLGTFAAVFPQYRQRSLNESNILHPESDWLMLVAEAGVPAAVAAAALGWLLWRRGQRWRGHRSWPLRWACAAAVAAACLHGVVDVPIHRVVLGWWVLALAGAGLHGGWTDGTRPSRLQHALFAAGGLLALGLGVGLIRAQWFGGPPLPPFAAEAAREEIDRAIQREDYPAAVSLCTRALPRAPLSERLYFQRGLLQVQAETDAVSDETFRAQRLVNPVLPSIPLAQGQLWLNDDPARTAAFWREALAQAERIHRNAGLGAAADVSFYRHLVSLAGDRPILVRSLLDVAGDRAAMILAWLESGPARAVGPQISLLTTDELFLRRLDQPELRRFLAAWYAHGERADLTRWLAGRTDWQTATWPLRLRLLVEGGQYEAAVRAVAEHDGIALDLPPVEPSSAPIMPFAQEAADPAAAFTAYWRAGNEVSARRLLAEGACEHFPSPPEELLRLRLALTIRDADWPAAWQATVRYLTRTGRADELSP